MNKIPKRVLFMITTYYTTTVFTQICIIKLIILTYEYYLASCYLFIRGGGCKFFFLKTWRLTTFWSSCSFVYGISYN